MVCAAKGKHICSHVRGLYRKLGMCDDNKVCYQLALTTSELEPVLTALSQQELEAERGQQVLRAQELEHQTQGGCTLVPISVADVAIA